jgi:murein DD-endopeptidase MepM/ murein hydrolase activator NlpD
MLILSAVAALLMFVLPWRELISAALPPLRQAPSITLPVNYDYISSPFGKRWGRQHQGIDFAADAGTPIRASSEGQVVYSGWEPGYGKTVLIEHGNGLQTRYAHCSSLLVTAGREVKKGSIIARVGSTGHSTGPHLHFEVLVRGVRKNPAWYYKFEPMDLEGKTDSFALLIQKTVFQVQRRLEMLLAKLYFPA